MTGKMFNMALRVMVACLFVFAVACNESYDDYSKYYGDESKGSWLVDQSTLKSWIDNDYKTGSGQKVVIIDATNNTNARAKNYIPGAVVLPTWAKSNYGMSRSDGVGSIGNQIPDGATMDANIRYAGIDKDTVIVITSNDWASANIGNAATRAWWCFYYWGFSKSNLKLLNGGNHGYDAEFGGLVSAPSVPAPSTFSVKDLPGNRIDQARAAFGDVYKNASNGAYAKRDRYMIVTLDPGYCYADGTCVANSGSVFYGRIHGAVQNAKAGGNTNNFGEAVDAANGTYYVFSKDTNYVRSQFVNNDTGESFLPGDKDTPITTHCGSGQSTSVAYFALVEVLGYKNVSIYDGSTSEWNVMSAYKYDNVTLTPVTYISTEAAATRTYLNWDKGINFFVDQNGAEASHSAIILYTGSNLTGLTGWDTSRMSDYVSFTTNAGSSTLTPAYAGEGREINEADKTYQSGGKTSGSGGASGGSGGAGC